MYITRFHWKDNLQSNKTKKLYDFCKFPKHSIQNFKIILIWTFAIKTCDYEIVNLKNKKATSTLTDPRSTILDPNMYVVHACEKLYCEYSLTSFFDILLLFHHALLQISGKCAWNSNSMRKISFEICNSWENSDFGNPK